MNLVIPTGTDQARECFTSMQTWPHWKEIQLGAQKEGMAKEDFYRFLPEFQRFMALSAGGYRGLGMLSEQVDRIWHAMILNTARYREFCQQYVGRFVEHLPCSSYELYGVSSSSFCNEPPSTCTDPWPAPPDPSPSPDEVRKSILSGTQRFIDAYTEVYGNAPSTAVWNQLSLADGIAQ